MACRIAVTGIGLVTPIGTGREEVWTGLLAGRSGFAPVASFDTSRHTVHLGAEVRGFDGAAWVRRLDPGYLGRASQMAIAAARMALDDAGLEEEELDAARAGVSMGTTSGEPREVEKLDDRYLAGETGPAGGGVHRPLPLPRHRGARRRRARLRRRRDDDPGGLRGGQLRHRARLRRPARAAAPR